MKIKRKKLKKGQTRIKYNSALNRMEIECSRLENGRIKKWTITAKKLLKFVFLTEPPESNKLKN